MFKELFYLSRSDRRALAFLLSVLLVFTILRIFLPRHSEMPADDVTASADTAVVRRTDTVVVVAGPEAVKRTYSDRTVRSAVRENGENRYADKVEPARTPFQKQEKYPYGTVIDLNAADTLELRKIPGIGRYYARRIIEYGNSLGGYVTTAQLGEIEGLPDSVSNWFMVADTFQVRKIMINEASLTELRAHPYMNFYMARAIVEYRRRNGKIRNPA